MATNESPSYQQTLQYCLRLLGQRGYSEAKLKEKLKRREVDVPTQQRILEYLKEIKLLDDVVYAGSVARSEALYRHASNRAIAFKLMQKGVDTDTQKSALRDGDLPSELERAQELVAKLRARNYPDQKILTHLSRKGFSYSVAKQACAIAK